MADEKRLGRRARRWLVLGVIATAAAAGMGIRLVPGLWPGQARPPRSSATKAVVSALHEVFAIRARALAKGDISSLEPVYETGGPGTARRALQHEIRKVRYVKAWASKRGAGITRADSHLQVKSVSLGTNTASAVVWHSLNVTYKPPGRSTVASNTFGIRTRHDLTLVRKNAKWLIRSDEYTDPLGEDTLAPEVAPASVLEPADSVVFTYPSGRPDTVPLETAARPGSIYNRWRAVAYADRYCGVNMGPGTKFGYNPAYCDYTDLGGDCTNFVSQVLGDRQAGGIPMDPVWHYDYSSRKGGSKAWVETDAFASHLTASGTARLLARGSFREVQAPTSRFPRGALAELAAGDIIAYEEKGKIQHFAVITGKDPSGYLLVNTHTADRYRVPWDLGWDKNTAFWLFEVVR
ncbi:MAG: amidase domain-containing protein [Bacillota bacterium]